MGIKFNKVSHIYQGNNKHDYVSAIKSINLDINEKDEFIAVIGKTGSGKSTLIQHMNALLIPTEGDVVVFDTIINKKNHKKLNNIRKRVGLVFQFPEYQLFEETVLKDVMFGPLNIGFSYQEAKEKALKALEMVGLNPSIYEKSPFNLSGGQMRKVAIASVLAMDTDILVLDEPTRGLDPIGQDEIMELFNNIFLNHHKTIVLISHDMNIVYKYATRCIVMKDSKIAFDGTKHELFVHDKFDEFSLEKPDILNSIDYLNKKLDLNIPYMESLDNLINYLKDGDFFE
jgi:energy-coupling factor transport system ATP-binding protein